MYSRALTQSVSLQPTSACLRDPDGGHRVEIQALNRLALRSLTSLFNERERLFSRCIRLTGDGFHHDASSRRSTIIALLGLKRLVETGAAQPFDLVSIRDAVLADTSWIKSVGDLGLLAWFAAEFVPEQLGGLIEELNFATALERYKDGQEACTTGLARYLVGIAQAQMATRGACVDLTDIAVDAYHLLEDNQSECGIFGHARCSGVLTRAFFNRFGTFADQIYAIHALSVFARAYGIEEPLASALSCGNAIRTLQGERGEWWFLYDKQTCRVANRYPVYSQHQDGTAPVGLLALEESTGQSFTEPVYRGIAWVSGANELGIDLRNFEYGLIWDSVSSTKRGPSYWETARSVLHISGMPDRQKLSIFPVAQADHFGWLLYAFAKFGIA